MAKCLVGATGGGKVTIENLSAEVLLTSIVAKVLQGSKEIAVVKGTLDVLAIASKTGRPGTTAGQRWSVGSGGPFYETGNSFSMDLGGTPKYAVVSSQNDGVTVTIGSTTVKGAGVKVITSFSNPANKTVTMQTTANCTTLLVVLGEKDA